MAIKYILNFFYSNQWPKDLEQKLYHYATQTHTHHKIVTENKIGDSQRKLGKKKSRLIKVTARRCLQSAWLVLIAANGPNHRQSWLSLHYYRTTRQVNQFSVSSRCSLKEPLSCLNRVVSPRPCCRFFLYRMAEK